VDLEELTDRLDYIGDRLASIADHLDQLDHLERLQTLSDALEALVEIAQQRSDLQFRHSAPTNTGLGPGRNCQAGGQPHRPPAEDRAGIIWHITLQLLRARTIPAAYHTYLEPTTARFIADILVIFAQPKATDWIIDNCRRTIVASLIANGYFGKWTITSRDPQPALS